VHDNLSDIRWYAFEIGRGALPGYRWLGTLHARNHEQATHRARRIYNKASVYVVSVLAYEACTTEVVTSQILPPLFRGVWWSPEEKSFL